MNTKLRTEAEKDIEKDFFKLMSNSVFRKTKESVRKHRDIKLVTTDKRRNHYSYLINDFNTAIKKEKGTKKCVIKRILKFNDYKNCLLTNEVILKSQQRFKSEAHSVYTAEINKIALSCNNDKRLQTFDRITSYPYGSIAGKVCKKEILRKYK